MRVSFDHKKKQHTGTQMGVSNGKFILPPWDFGIFWLGDPLVHVPATEDFMIHILPQRVANPEISLL
jgi:hypothetical protein